MRVVLGDYESSRRSHNKLFLARDDMSIDHNRISKIDFFAYLVVIIVFITSLSFPLIFKYVGPYSAATAVYANQVLKSGGLPSDEFISEPPHKYWKSAIKTEVDYPAPSLILSIFILITNIPKDYAMFIPISGVANIIYFVLGKKILCSDWKRNRYGLLFSAFYYAFVTFSNIHATYVGRAVSGLTLFTYFLFCYILFLHEYATNRSHRSWLMMLLLLTLAIGYTYYTTTLAIIAITSLAIAVLIVAYVRASIRKLFLYAGISITIPAIFICIYNPFVTALASAKSLTSLIDNFIQYIQYVLRIEAQQSEAWQLYVGFIEADFLSVLGKRIVSVIGYVSIIALVVSLFVYKPRDKPARSHMTMWFFSVIILLSSLSEITYLIVIPTAPLRLLTMYGPIAMLFLGGDFISRSNKFWRSRHTHREIIAFLIILIIALGCWGSLRWAWYYGMYSAKPLAYDEVYPLSVFLCIHSSGETPITIAGDAYYMANVFFIVSLYNKVNNVAPEPLERDAITLYESLLTGRMENISIKMRWRGIDYLLLVKTTRPLYGDGWGYTVTLPNDYILYTNTNLIYSNRYSRLFRIRS